MCLFFESGVKAHHFPSAKFFHKNALTVSNGYAITTCAYCGGERCQIDKMAVRRDFMISYASPKFAKKVAKVFGVKKASQVKITMRSTQDVPKFLKKFDAIQKRTAQSTLQLD